MKIPAAFLRPAPKHVPDRRDPEVLVDAQLGRKFLVDQAVLDPMRGIIPADDPVSPATRLLSLRPPRISLVTRPRC